jgi:spore maturation protein CgeB
MTKIDCAAFPPIGIVAYSDFYDLPDRKVWGDYWFKENLLREFEKFGYPADNSRPKILLHLFGEPLEEISSETYNILWIHSHPDRINPRVLEKYRKIYCISPHFCGKITAMGFHAEPLIMPTNMRPVKAKKKFDIVFVGNTKQQKIRKIIRDMGSPPYNIKIWGWGWKGLIPDEWYGGEYYENSRLNELYASSRIVLNDHHEDMQREGFINPRVLDVLASGGFVVSDRVWCIDEFFGKSVPVYESPEDLRRIIEYFVHDEAARDALSKKGLEIALQYTYSMCCETIIRHIESVSGTLFL